MCAALAALVLLTGCSAMDPTIIWRARGSFYLGLSEVFVPPQIKTVRAYVLAQADHDYDDAIFEWTAELNEGATPAPQIKLFQSNGGYITSESPADGLFEGAPEDTRAAVFWSETLGLTDIPDDFDGQAHRKLSDILSLEPGVMANAYGEVRTREDMRKEMTDWSPACLTVTDEY